ncbi:MAG TPA: dTDP-4-dehydrorhamnose reductase [Methanospirillum sp.]|uniref:dTDP-4-dehydrorhamnose reductase n=1 Tax=Methanospirillum sp. TaxID=45200 RepID=UPI002C9D9C8B|nr:dTDP-4-dehydrorhamnose reductase [Methanospirillum sp.]HWQ63429.1 dTDP-4-dehydrorhamnose reductase [Methanospirillum sp.]
MKILITGAHGQLGTDITRLCRAMNWVVISYGSQDLDITRYHDVMTKIPDIRPDIIINCAAYNDVDKAKSDWEQAYQVNGLGPKNLALAASASGAVLVHYSTDYVFNGETNLPYTLGDKPDPISRYGASKLIGEQMVMRHALKYFLIRTSWVFGGGNTNFVQKVLDWSNQRGQITVVDDQISSPTYTRDLAQGRLDLIESGQYGLYHMTNSGHCSRYEWGDYILSQIGWTGELTPGKSANFHTPATRPAFSVLDNFGTIQTIGRNLPLWQDATNRFLREIGRI